MFIHRIEGEYGFVRSVHLKLPIPFAANPSAPATNLDGCSSSQPHLAYEQPRDPKRLTCAGGHNGPRGVIQSPVHHWAINQVSPLPPCGPRLPPFDIGFPPWTCPNRDDEVDSDDMCLASRKVCHSSGDMPWLASCRTRHAVLINAKKVTRDAPRRLRLSGFQRPSTEYQPQHVFRRR